MCLNYNERLTERTRKQFKKKPSRMVWKVLVHRLQTDNACPRLVSPVRYTEWRSGTKVSSRSSCTLTSEEERFKNIERGLHVFFTEKAARAWSGLDADRIVKLRVFAKDFVAAGLGKEAVFRRVQLSKSEYKRAMVSNDVYARRLKQRQKRLKKGK